MDARESYHEIVTESPDRIVRAPWLDHLDHEAAELGHLGLDQPTDEIAAHLDLIVMHPHGH